MKYRFNVMVIEMGPVREGAMLMATRTSPRVRRFMEALEASGTGTERVGSYASVIASPQLMSQAQAFVVALEDFSQVSLEGFEAFVRDVRARNENVPVFLLGENPSTETIASDVLKELHGIASLAEDTPEFFARQVAREAKAYTDSLAPPFFKALLEYASQGSYSWHCPGHSGGAAFLKSPVGQVFHQYFGENMLRADVCNAVEELGQLLDHTGAAAAAERNAARIFRADHLFFVTNGTSTSNKIVWHSAVAADDIVVVDRNCHKSVLHAIMMTGAIPVFLNPTRNPHGLIGPIPAEEFTIESIQRKIDANPFILDKSRKPRLLALTQSTYDGILYNAPVIQRLLDGKIDLLHFDEAWLPHAAFHPIYDGMHAIDSTRERLKESMVFATQSTHKTLAGLSQASQILVREPEARKLNRAVFNEAYLMHSSTSPQYSIIASCDVAAAMMDGAGGQALVEDSIREADDFRSAMAKVAGDCRTSDWWFEVWGPPAGQPGSRDRWILKPGDAWHGFGAVEPGFNMLDPIKVTVLTPGLSSDGSFEEAGIPASVVAKFLVEHGVIVEKCGLYSFFILFAIGVTQGRWASLVTALQRFKDAFDRNVPVARVMPRFALAHPRYGEMGLRDLCQGIHSAYSSGDVARMTTRAYLSGISLAMLPSAAFAHVARGQVERVGIDRLKGRVASALLTPYPPGIPLLVPGERFNSAIVEYLRVARELGRTHPGFGTDVHGLVTEDGGYFVDCVKEG